jgi:CheY-like chemotaxis protein
MTEEKLAAVADTADVPLRERLGAWMVDWVPRRPSQSTWPLIADDDPDGSELLAVVLRLEGAEVRTAKDATEALEQLDAGWTPDAMLLDLGMPEIDGYDLLDAIRGREALRRVPAFAVTAYAFHKDAAKVAASGFAAHVTKPYELDELVDAVVEVIASRPGARSRPDA